MKNSIFCFFGIHDWKITFDENPKQERECKCCGKEQSNTYDMCYGGTYWVNGKNWSITIK